MFVDRVSERLGAVGRGLSDPTALKIVPRWVTCVSIWMVGGYISAIDIVSCCLHGSSYDHDTNFEGGTPQRLSILYYNFCYAVSLYLPHPHSHPYSLTRPLSWIQSQDMGAFLSIAKGSEEDPWLLEVHYNYRQGEESGEQPIVLVGKGGVMCVCVCINSQ